MRRNDPISKIMATDLITVSHGDPISKIRRLFHEHNVHHLPVVRGKELIGIVSWTDLMRVSFGDAFQTDEREVDATLDHTLTLEQLMLRSPRTVRKDATIRDAAELMAQGDIHSVPVVDVDGKTLVGMVTSTDLIRYLLDHL